MGDNSTTMGSFALGALTEEERGFAPICRSVGLMMCQSALSKCHRWQLISSEEISDDEIDECLWAAHDAGYLGIWVDSDDEPDTEELREAGLGHRPAGSDDECPEEGPWIRLAHPEGYELVKKAWPDFDWELLG